MLNASVAGVHGAGRHVVGYFAPQISIAGYRGREAAGRAPIDLPHAASYDAGTRGCDGFGPGRPGDQRGEYAVGNRLSIALWPFRMTSRLALGAARLILPEWRGQGKPTQASQRDWAPGSSAQDLAEGAYIQPEAAFSESDLQMTVAEVRRRQDDGEGLVLLDIREPHEYDLGHLPGAAHLPLEQLGLRFQELDPGHAIVAYGSAGPRGLSAAQRLHGLGFPKVWFLAGGFAQWVVEDGAVSRPGDAPDEA